MPKERRKNKYYILAVFLSLFSSLMPNILMNTIAKFFFILVLGLRSSTLSGQIDASKIVKNFTRLLNEYEQAHSSRNYDSINQLREDLFVSEDIPYYDFSQTQKDVPIKLLLSRLKRSEGNKYISSEIENYQDSARLYKVIVLMKEYNEYNESASKDTLVFTLQQPSKITAIYHFQDTDRDGMDDRSDHCPNEIGDFLVFGCPDGDKDGVPDALDSCLNTPPNVSVTPYGCWDKDGDGIPNFKDNCIEEAGTAAICGCPDTNKSYRLEKLNALTRLHPVEEITVLQWVENRLVSGSKNGRLSVSSIKDKKFKANKLIKTISDEPHKILPLEGDNLLISTRNDLILVGFQEDAFGNANVIDNKKYLNLKRLGSQIFLQEQSGWLSKTIEANKASYLTDIQQISINRDAMIATYDKRNMLSIYDQEISLANLNQTFELALDKPIYLEAYQNSSWLLINNRGMIAMANHICLGSFPSVSNDKRIVSIKQSKGQHLIALLFEDKTWEIWQKHPIAATWKKINNQKFVKERTTAIELSEDGKYFFEGTDDGILQAYLIEEK